jgi:hypothetical protein
MQAIFDTEQCIFREGDVPTNETKYKVELVYHQGHNYSANLKEKEQTYRRIMSTSSLESLVPVVLFVH